MIEIASVVVLAILINKLIDRGKIAQATGDNATAYGLGFLLVVLGIPALLLAGATALTAINGGVP